jgi:hypothetical protein
MPGAWTKLHPLLVTASGIVQALSHLPAQERPEGLMPHRRGIEIAVRRPADRTLCTGIVSPLLVIEGNLHESGKGEGAVAENAPAHLFKQVGFASLPGDGKGRQWDHRFSEAIFF